ncbi:aladin WD repeat nucleoporin [Anaeramoeba flamelloides]|uniref:Aladin WD repeat nucleoporin n=1 Tax=Anaeramoeba flamelloides TaxID=1746091 RepID=A0AAV7ZIE7_9EUKA|nr:aladin WD repeat nucleoporin [Anaeramoeba flamelloides]
MSVSLSLCGYNRRILYLYKDERDEETISDYSQRGGVIYPIIKHDKTKTGKPLACFSWHNYLQKFYISVSLSKIGIFNVSQSKWESHSIPHHNNEVVKVLQSRPCSGNTIACGCESGKVYIWRIYSLPLFDKKKKMKMRYSRQINQRNKPNRNRSLQKQKHKKRKNKNLQYLAMDSDEESNDDFINCPKYEEMDDESDESNNNYEESDEEDEYEEEEDDEFALLKNKFFRKLEKESESEKENQLLAEFSHGKAEIYDLCWSPTGKYLAVATSKNLVIWDISRKKSEKIKQGKLGSKIALVKWSHSGRLLFIATNMKEIIVFNTINWESYCWNMNSNVTDACWDHNSQFIIISCRGETKLWILSFEQKQETKGEFVTSIDISKFLTLQNVSQYIYPTRNHKRKKRGEGERNRRKKKTLSKYEQSKMDFLKKQKEKQNQEIFNEKEIEIIQEDDDDEQEEEDDDRNNRNNILPSSDEESDEEYGAQYSEENENEIENEELNNKIDEQIEIRKVTIDPYGKRIAILFNPNSIVGNLIGLLSLGRRKQNRGYQFSWIGFFNTLPEHGFPKLIKFRKNHTRGALLATVWSSFIVKLFPLYFRK